ncbi:hypothetical protein GWK47_016731 [Chionoecetes opilio]|uniref:CCHC-type domain-containing protein n=1 Tax=Chionoecetes opilio TaxID=41210 RepID=A0A8J4XT57_CHIOP|nr:hypothetical protein GWK47_016731 [Chionoecetes opilio]
MLGVDYSSHSQNVPRLRSDQSRCGGSSGMTIPSPYQHVRWLESELQLAITVDVSATREFLLLGETRDAAATLQEVADGQPRGIVLARREPSRRGVLVRYPTGLPMDPVLEHPLVNTAVRCSYNAGLKRHLPTRQVQLTLRGHVPAALDLGCYGTFTVRRFIQEPVRCYRCQAFGHYQRQCQQRQELCGVCSGEHASWDCIRRLRDGGERPVSRCPNCGARHHAWNRRCPARLRQIPGSTVPCQLQWKEAPLLPPRSAPQPTLHGLKTPSRPDGPTVGGGRRGPSVTVCCPLWGIWTWTPRPP